MSQQTNNRKVRYAAAPTDISTDATSGFVYPRCLEAEPGVDLKTYDREFLSPKHSHFQVLRGEKTASPKLVMDLRGFGGSPAGAGSGVAASDGENGLLLKSVFGNQTKDTGNTCAAGTTASIIKATSAANLSTGGIIGLVDTAGAYHARQIRSKATNDITIDRDLPFTPAGTDVIYASSWFSHATEGHPHVWIDIEGYTANAANNWRRYLRGCLGDLVLTLAGQGKMEFNFKALDWHDASGTSMGSETFPTNLPAYGMTPGRGTRVWLGATSTLVSSLGFKLGNKVQEKLATAAPQGISGFRIDKPEMTFEFTALHEDGGNDFVTGWTAGTLYDLLIEVTKGGPGNSCAIAAPVVEVLKVADTSVNGLHGYQVTGRVLDADLGSVQGLPDAVFALL